MRDCATTLDVTPAPNGRTRRTGGAMRCVAAVIAAAGLAIGATGLAAASETRPGSEPTPARVLESATSLLSDGQPVRASHLLRGLAASDAAIGMSTAEQTRYFDLIRSAERDIERARPVAVSLERAQIALIEGDLVSAEWHAGAVLRHSDTLAEERGAAEAVNTMVSSRRRALSGMLDDRLNSAQSAFDAGRYAESGAIVGELLRAGATGTAEQASRLEGLRARVTDLDPSLISERGPVSFALMGPPEDEKPESWLAGRAGDGRPAPVAAVPLGGGEAEVGLRVAAQPGDEQPPATGVDPAVSAEAGRLLTEANDAFVAGRMGSARDLYEELLQPIYRSALTVEQVDGIQENLAEAQLALRAGPGEFGDQGGLLGPERDDRQIALQRFRAEFNSFLTRAEEAVAQGDVETARREAAQANLVLLESGDLLSATDKAVYEGEIADLFTLIETEGERQNRLQAEEQNRQLEEQVRVARREAAEARERRIRELLERIYALQLEQDYEAALQEVDNLLFIDPNNTVGKLMKNVLRDTIILKTYAGARADVQRGIAEQAADNIVALVPPREIIKYPDDWVEISRRRSGAQEYVESAVNRSVLATLENTRQRIDFQEAAISDALTFVAQIADVEMDIDWDSLDEIGVDRDDPVSLQLTNVPLNVVLDRALEKVSPDTPAGWAVRDGVVTVASDDVLRRNRVFQIYDIRDLVFEIPDAEDPPDFDLNSIFSQGGQGGGGGGHSPFQSQQQDRETPDREAQLERLIEIVQNFIERTEWEAAGGTGGTIQTYESSLLVNAPDYIHRQLVGYAWWPAAGTRSAVVDGQRRVSLTPQGVRNIERLRTGVANP